MSELRTTEKYALAQILVCGAIDEEEFRSVNDYKRSIQGSTLTKLRRYGLLEQTLYDGGLLQYEENNDTR